MSFKAARGACSYHTEVVVLSTSFSTSMCVCVCIFCSVSFPPRQWLLFFHLFFLVRSFCIARSYVICGYECVCWKLTEESISRLNVNAWAWRAKIREVMYVQIYKYETSCIINEVSFRKMGFLVWWMVAHTHTHTDREKTENVTR